MTIHSDLAKALIKRSSQKKTESDRLICPETTINKVRQNNNKKQLIEKSKQIHYHFGLRKQLHGVNLLGVLLTYKLNLTKGTTADGLEDVKVIRLWSAVDNNLICFLICS